MVWSRLLTACRSAFLRLSRSSSIDQPPVAAPEAVTRFIFSSRHFARTQGRVRAPAISPQVHEETGRLELSIYRADNATSAELWEICTKYVDNPAVGRVAKARGTCFASTMFRHGLSFDADGKPHARHANVIGWPDPPKHELKIIQQKIAAAMTLEVRVLVS